MLLSILIFFLFSLTPLAVRASDTPTILVLGDSLSAAHGLRPEQGWVSLLADKLSAEGYPHRVVNAGISGETTAGGRNRLDKLLTQEQPVVAILELGANDALRGLSLKKLRANLAAMIERCQAAGAQVVLVGMRMPDNYGKHYTERFHALYGELAVEYKSALVPFLLEGIALDPAMFQADGLHPVADAQPRLLENVWKVLQTTLTAETP